MRRLRTGLFRLAAVASLAAIVAGSVELHVGEQAGLTSHGSLRGAGVARPLAPCAPGQLAHLDSADWKVERPCEACLRSVERRVVAASPSHLPSACVARWAPDRRTPYRLASTTFDATQVRGPPTLLSA